MKGVIQQGGWLKYVPHMQASLKVPARTECGVRVDRRRRRLGLPTQLDPNVRFGHVLTDILGRGLTSLQCRLQELRRRRVEEER
eukprot:scaffold12784_cov31-Tisochrysis_lutea.AAC.2